MTEAVIGSASIPIADSAGEEFEAAVRAHAALVYRIAFAVLHNHHDAEDAAQETFFRYWRYRKRDIRDLAAWLARVAWRVSLDRRRPSAEVGLEDAAREVLALRAQGAGPEELAATRQMAALLERLIESLPRELREALPLATVEELTSAEIAEILGIPEGSVRSRLARARQLLREKLAALLERKHGR